MSGLGRFQATLDLLVAFESNNKHETGNNQF